VYQDDDLGALAASFNRMQAGLAERQRLQAAFGTYVDPVLVARLLEQGHDVFTGERREVSVMFVDIRDFTPFAEANPAEDIVARLNALFEIVVPAVVDAGGHVNKLLGDGALAVFGAPNDLADHADAAVTAAVLIHRLVAERFGGELRIGIGINTGVVIAGTIGGAGKLEFILIGDTVNVAARVEQLTKTTGDTILLTEQCVAALVTRPPGLTDRGSHALKFAANPITRDANRPQRFGPTFGGTSPRIGQIFSGTFGLHQERYRLRCLRRLRRHRRPNSQVTACNSAPRCRPTVRNLCIRLRSRTGPSRHRSRRLETDQFAAHLLDIRVYQVITTRLMGQFGGAIILRRGYPRWTL
jgi:class 3 adenylate cyclase